MHEQVQQALEKIRPFLQQDGGDVELVEVNEDEGLVKVKMTGGCSGCPFAQMTLKNGIERVIKDNVPGVNEVIAV